MITKDDLRFYREPHRVLEKGEDYVSPSSSGTAGLDF